MNFKNKIFPIGLLASLLLTSTVSAAPPPGATTAPYTVSYSARLTNSSGVAITTARDIRFSLWSDNDFDPTDLLVGGGIDPAAVGFTGWTETYTVTPDSNGIFHVRLGSISTLPNFTLSTDVYLQVDVKKTTDPDTSYEVLDPDGNTANLTDRYPLDSAAFAINADTVDNADVGSAAWNIPQLDGGGFLPVSTIPLGTNEDSFTLDNNNTVGAGSIILRFGAALNKILEYDNVLGRFNFNDNVNVTGNFTVTGNADFSTSNEFHMREVPNKLLAACTTVKELVLDTTENKIYTCTAIGAPGTWFAAAGATTAAYAKSLVYEPEYADTVYNPDGTSNNGKLEIKYVDTDGDPGNLNFNYYKWTTLQAGMNDMDLVMRVQLPEDFTGWQATPVEFTYNTASAVLADNRLDVSLFDTLGANVPLTGASALATAGTAATSSITFGGAPTFTAGQTITIVVKLSADNLGEANASKIKLNYNGLL